MKSKKNSGKDLFDAIVYRDSELTGQFHDMVCKLYKMCGQAKPTKFHHMLASIAQQGRLQRLYSQNIDSLEVGLEPLKTSIPLPPKAPWPKTVRVHGGLDMMTCQKCQWVKSFDPELFTGNIPPDCPECIESDSVRDVVGARRKGTGKLRPRLILYNEDPYDGEAVGSIFGADLKAKPDAFIVVGTTVKVHGTKKIVKEMCKNVQSRKTAMTIWINLEDPPTELMGLFDIIVKGDCEKIAELVALPRWDAEQSIASHFGGTSTGPTKITKTNGAKNRKQLEVLREDNPDTVWTKAMSSAVKHPEQHENGEDNPRDDAAVHKPFVTKRKSNESSVEEAISKKPKISSDSPCQEPPDQATQSLEYKVLQDASTLCSSVPENHTTAISAPPSGSEASTGPKKTQAKKATTKKAPTVKKPTTRRKAKAKTTATPNQIPHSFRTTKGSVTMMGITKVVDDNTGSPPPKCNETTLSITA